MGLAVDANVLAVAGHCQGSGGFAPLGRQILHLKIARMGGKQVAELLPDVVAEGNLLGRGP